MTLQDHPRSLILAPVESAYRTSYCSLIVTLHVVLPCRISEILELFTPTATFFRTPPLFRPKFRGVPLGIHPWCRVCGERILRAN